MNYNINKKRQLSQFVQHQRNERFAFNFKQHKAALEFKARQIKERQQFINELEQEGGEQC